MYIGDLYSGQPCQRAVEDSAVNKPVRDWGSRLLNPLVVSYRSGRYYRGDGQHRVCAMRRKTEHDIIPQGLWFTPWPFLLRWNNADCDGNWNNRPVKCMLTSRTYTGMLVLFPAVQGVFSEAGVLPLYF